MQYVWYGYVRVYLCIKNHKTETHPEALTFLSAFWYSTMQTQSCLNNWLLDEAGESLHLHLSLHLALPCIPAKCAPHTGWGSKVMGRRWSMKKVREKNHITRERNDESAPTTQGQMYLPG